MRSICLGVLLISATAAADAPRTRDSIARVVAGRSDTLRACYEQARKGAPTLEGTFVYTLTIGATGRVTKPVAKAPTKTTTALDACVTKELAKLVFEPGAETVINYPFVFKPEETKPAKPTSAEDPVDPTLVKMFNDATKLAQAGKHKEALAAFRAVLETQRAKKLAVIPRFTSTVRLQLSYELIDLGKLAEAEKELGLVDLATLGKPKQYDYYFTLGNVLGARAS
ncbi:MAG: AgmX/PglI C-terminal domain-containing protein [Deltaproteobacteria bacterium]|nr:AgmX/PglI C-terminal domain-containing protein [Deltaproteobacteria bacterium]